MSNERDHDDLMPDTHLDALVPDEPFDAAQFAMHGLLTVSFDTPAAQSARAQTILRRVQERQIDESVQVARGASRPITGAPAPAGGRLSLAPPARGQRGPFAKIIKLPWRWLGMGTLGAAAATIVVVIVLTSDRQVIAESFVARIAREALVAMQTLEVFSAYSRPPDNIRDLEAAMHSIEESRRQRDVARAQSQLLADARDRAASAERAMEPWAHICRRLRDVGRCDEALAEVQEWTRFIEDSPSHGRQAGWYDVALDDLASIHRARGKLDDARKAIEQSIAAREARSARAEAGAEYPERDRLRGRVGSLSPVYYRLFDLALLERNPAVAGQWVDRVESVLREYFVGVCRAWGKGLPENASLSDAFEATPTECRAPRENYTPEEMNAFAAAHLGYIPDASINTHLRAFWYARARLLIVVGNSEGAVGAIAKAQAIMAHPVHDEYRLDFALPLEAGRLSIIRGDYAAALRQLAEAESHWGEFRGTYWDGTPKTRPAISPGRRAELKLLRGLALLGQNPENSEARKLTCEALAVPESSINVLPPERRAAFKRQLSAWQALIGRRAEHSQ